jgi:CBS domain-containing protein
MKRLNITEAFVGEGSGADDHAAEPSNEAVLLAVRGGEVAVVVPPGTPDEKVLDGPTVIRGTLRLENEHILHFEIHERATGGFFEDESAESHRRRAETGSVGLSSIEGPVSRGIGRQRACDVMTGEVICTHPDISVQELSRLLVFHNVSALPVVDEHGTVLGVASEADVIAKRGATVGDIMTRALVAADEDTSVEALAKLMAERKVKRVLIMQGDRLVGLVSRADLVRALAGG